MKNYKVLWVRLQLVKKSRCLVGPSDVSRVPEPYPGHLLRTKRGRDLVGVLLLLGSDVSFEVLLRLMVEIPSAYLSVCFVVGSVLHRMLSLLLSSASQRVLGKRVVSGMLLKVLCLPFPWRIRSRRSVPLRHVVGSPEWSVGVHDIVLLPNISSVPKPCSGDLGPCRPGSQTMSG